MANSGLQFHFTYEPGVTQQQKIAFEMAGKAWARYVKDDITVNIHVDVSDDLEPGVIGGALPGFVTQNYSNVRNALASNQLSEEDQAAVANLDEGQSVNFDLVGIASTDFDNYLAEGTTLQFGVDNAIDSLQMTNANAKSLGLPQANGLDGHIMMSSLHNFPMQWYYETGENAVPTGHLDFVSVAIHEIGHILGFVSGTDMNHSQWNDFVTTDSQAPILASLSSLLKRTSYTTTLDLLVLQEKVCLVNI